MSGKSKSVTMSTRGFLAYWHLMWLSVGVAQSWLYEHAIGGLDGTWVFHVFVWLAVVWIILLGNHMATGSVFLRGLKDWP